MPVYMLAEKEVRVLYIGLVNLLIIFWCNGNGMFYFFSKLYNFGKGICVNNIDSILTDITEQILRELSHLLIINALMASIAI